MASRELRTSDSITNRDTLFVAVGKDFKSNSQNVDWTLRRSGGKRIFIFHVHQPSEWIPAGLSYLHVSKTDDKAVKAHHEKEKNEMLGLLAEYAKRCAQAGVQAETKHIEADSIEKGIVTFISQHKVGWLIMGAAKRFSRNMIQIRSEKALYVRSQAPAFCHIWFVCEGRLIFTRQATMPTNAENEEVQENQPDIDEENLPISAIMPQNAVYLSSTSSSRTSSEIGGSDDQFDQLSRSLSRMSGISSTSSLSVPLRENEQQRDLSYPMANSPQSSSPWGALVEKIDELLCDQLEAAVVEAENLRRETYAESLRPKMSEKNAIDSLREAKANETLYVDECTRRRQVEEETSNRNEEVRAIRDQPDEFFDELRVARCSFDNEIKKYKVMVKELEDKVVSTENLLQKYKEERDDMQIQRDDALREAEELRNQVSVLNSTSTTDVAEFSMSEILSATDNLNTSMKIGEGGYGSIFRATLRHTQVAIKVLKPESSQGLKEFQQEVDTLRKLRHPNIVNLIGICREASALIYEYLPNGSLEDRLNCEDDSAPLTWQKRIQIAKEVCSVLMFLQSGKPQSIIHGDLKPGNILLDGQLSSKLGDFGICRAITYRHTMMEACHQTIPRGTVAYMDPQFLVTGELTAKSDVYSYGIVLLRLLTGKPPVGIAREVRNALDEGRFEKMLDPSAGDWPLDEAKELGYLALRCSDSQRKNRPDLAAEVWGVIESVWISCCSSLRKP